MEANMSVITISRQFGAGGLTLGRKLAGILDYTLIDKQIISLISEKAKVSTDWVQAIEKEAGGKLHQFINRLIPSRLVDRILDDEQGYIDEEIYILLLEKIINQIAEKDNCIILGRGGQYILRNRPNTFHVLLIAEKKDRIGFMQSQYKLDHNKAVNVVQAEDKRRINLYRKFEKSDYDLPGHYHLTLNMSKLNLDSSASIIEKMVTRTREPQVIRSMP
jgi:cytidylate kinase